jgi:hypothetical protein
MRKITVLGSLAAAGFAAGAMGSCVSAKGASWPETLAQAGAPTEDRAHVVLLRPDQRYDDASLSRIIVRIDGRVIGKLAYGGFLLADVPAGELTLKSPRKTAYGCKRRFASPANGSSTPRRVPQHRGGRDRRLVGGSVVGGPRRPLKWGQGRWPATRRSAQAPRPSRPLS